MKCSGSVLIVVLGLLAILAIVGVTFVTMSNLDRSSAESFAIQSQFMLAADGAVDYVSHHLVMDLWEWKHATSGTSLISTYQTLLLSNANITDDLMSNEPFDFPGTTTAGIGADDWLATIPDDEAYSGTTDHFSYQGAIFTRASNAATAPFGVTQWAATGPCAIAQNERPNALGFPGTGGRVEEVSRANGHALWNPDLSFPHETGLIRVAVVVLDHGGMINFNAHGNGGSSLSSGPMAGIVGRGYFISDVDPAVSGLSLNISELLTGTTPPGRWRDTPKEPGNPNLMETVIENPAKYRDRPFTMEEEVELRRLTGTAYESRLESMANGLRSNPNAVKSPVPPTGVKAQYRLTCTTVGWTSQARGFDRATGLAIAHDVVPTEGVSGAWSTRKADLNLDPPDAIFKALVAGYAVPSAAGTDSDRARQFCANIAGFRDGSNLVGIRKYTVGGKSMVSASRQPIFSEISAKSKPNSDGGSDWDIELEIYSPWTGNKAAMDDGLSVDGITITGASVPDWPPPGDRMDPSGILVLKFTVQGGNSSTLTDALGSLAMRCEGVDIDRIDLADLTKLGTGGSMSRPIYREEAPRGDGDPAPDIVVCIGDWKEGGASMGSVSTNTKPATPIPVRFPRSVDKDNIPNGGLPPRKMTEYETFRAIARVGDLNQVLYPADADFWPWVVKVAKLSDSAGNESAERSLKWSWDPIATPTTWPPAQPARIYAANVLSCGGPWLDNLDNDGDGCVDDNGGKLVTVQDVGTEKGGRFGGPEMRVAGLVNLNTATPSLLDAMEKGLGLSGLKSAVITLRTQKKPIFSPAQLISSLTVSSGETPLSKLEQDQLAWARLSNVATVRSDTYSVYGMVQYIDTQLMSTATTPVQRQRAVRRTRRFWALIDRSPCLAYVPTASDFSRPRVMNFQWMD
jgi:hypothetical protein